MRACGHACMHACVEQRNRGCECFSVGVRRGTFAQKNDPICAHAGHLLARYRGEYAGPTRKFHRRKGMSEFAEIAQVPRSQWTPAHRQAMEQNSTVFHRQVGEFAAVIEALHHRATAKAEGEKAARQRPQSARPASRPAQASPRLAEKTQQARASAVPVPAATPQEPAKAPPPAGGRTSARPTHQAAKAAARGPSQARPAK